MKNILLMMITWLCLGVALQAQNIPQNPNLTDKDGKRQGQWTILYDKGWNIITDANKAEFYRTLTYQDDKPTGIVKDHYKNGIVQMEATLLADRPKEVIDGLVVFYDAQGKKEKEAIYKNGKVESEKSFLDPNSWKALNGKGLTLFNAGKYQEAQEYWEKAKAQAEKEFGIEHQNYANSLNNLASLYWRQGDYPKAEPFYKQTLEIFRKVLGEMHPDFALSLNNLAALYERQGDYSKAEPLMKQSLEIRRKVLGEMHPDFASSLNSLALLYQTQGDYPKAEPLCKQALEIRRKALGEMHPNFAQSLNTLALLYQTQGDYPKAELLMKQALEIRRKALGEMHPDFAKSLNNLAELYRAPGDYPKAEPLYKQALEIHRKVLGEMHPSFATSLNSLAGLYMAQGNYPKAEPLYKQALEIYRKVLGEMHPEFANSLNNLALLYKTQGDYPKAEPLCKQAMEIRRKVLGEMHPSVATSLNTLAVLYLAQDDYSEAEPLCKQASKVLIGQIEGNFSNLSEKEKGLFLKTFSRYFEVYNSFTLKAYRQSPTLTGWIYDNTLAIKGLLFQSTEKMRRSVLSSGDTSLIRLFEDWKSKREYMAKVATLTIAQKQKREIDEQKLEAEANDLEKQLSLRASNFQGLSADKTRYTWQDIQKSLKKGEAAIEIIRTRYHDKKWTDSVLYIALIVRPDTKEQPEMVVLPNGKEMESKYFGEYGGTVTRGLRDDSTKINSGDLEFDPNVFVSEKRTPAYTTYWQPIYEALSKQGKPTKIYIALDGIYHKISLLSLQNPETKKYILDEVEIHQVGSTKDIVKWQQPNKAKNTSSKPDAVLVGYPAYNLSQEAYKTYLATPGESRGDDIGSRLENIYWKPLSGTEIEINTIAKTLQAQKIPVQTYMQAKASEELVKRVQFPRILHIATHGAFFEKEESKADDRNRSGNEANQVVEFSPMLRSGLALAGISNFYQSKDRPQTDDGFLTAYEAMNLNLDNTELVVLSACETGLGEAKSGEGVFGLQRGFQTAGAKTVLMSLWSVDDAATQELMTLFYTNWLAKKQTKRKAFKNAQLTLRKTYPQPYYWGAFVMVGE